MRSKNFKFKLNFPRKPRGSEHWNNVEAIKATIRNFRIIKLFARAAFDFADAMILSGSMAWGSFRAVTRKSDIDLLVIAKDPEQLGHLIDRYISMGLLNRDQKQRFEIYRNLHNKKMVDQFSLVTNYEGVIIDFNFIPIQIIEKICKLKPIRPSKYKGKPIEVRVINEFRSVVPKIKGYAMDDLMGSVKLTYHPKFNKIRNDQGSVMGYLAESCVNGIMNTKNKIRYLSGVWSFFVGISPIILFDKSGRVTRLVKIFQSNIAKILGKQTPTYVTRQERMPEDVLKRIKQSLV